MNIITSMFNLREFIAKKLVTKILLSESDFNYAKTLTHMLVIFLLMSAVLFLIFGLMAAIDDMHYAIVSALLCIAFFLFGCADIVQYSNKLDIEYQEKLKMINKLQYIFNKKINTRKQIELDVIDHLYNDVIKYQELSVKN